MTIESLKHFLCVAEGNTFMNAAEECNISQSSLSKSIQRLEQELGVALFDRRARAAKLTEAGKVLYADLQSLSPAFEATLVRVRSFSELKRINCCPIPGLPVFVSMVSQFSKKNPTITVTVRRERDYKRALAFLSAGELDFICFHRPLVPAQQCEEIVLFEDRLYAVMPEQHHLAANTEVSLEDLAGQRLLLDDYIYSNIRDVGALFGKRFDVQLMPADREGNILSVAEGQGIALYYQSDIRAFKMNNVVAVPVANFPHQPFVFVYSKRMKMSIEHLLFKEFIGSSFARLRFDQPVSAMRTDRW